MNKKNKKVKRVRRVTRRFRFGAEFYNPVNEIRDRIELLKSKGLNAQEINMVNNKIKEIGDNLLNERELLGDEVLKTISFDARNIRHVSADNPQKEAAYDKKQIEYSNFRSNMNKYSEQLKQIINDVLWETRGRDAAIRDQLGFGARRVFLRSNRMSMFGKSKFSTFY